MASPDYTITPCLSASSKRVDRFEQRQHQLQRQQQQETLLSEKTQRHYLRRHCACHTFRIKAAMVRCLTVALVAFVLLTLGLSYVAPPPQWPCPEDGICDPLGAAVVAGGGGEGGREQSAIGMEGQSDQPLDTSFSILLHSVSSEALHRVLHAYFPKRYRHGVFASEHSAMEAVHADDAALATTLVELARRQGGGGNSSASLPTSKSSSSSSPPPPPPPPTRTTGSSSNPVTTTTTTTAPQPPTTSSKNPPPPSSTTAPPGESSDPTTTTSPAMSPDSALSSPLVASSSPVKTTAETSILATTTAIGATEPPPEPSTYTSTLISTLPDGSLVTMTSTVVAIQGPPQTVTSPRPGGLQTGAAVPRHQLHDNRFGIFAGAVIGGILAL